MVLSWKSGILHHPCVLVHRQSHDSLDRDPTACYAGPQPKPADLLWCQRVEGKAPVSERCSGGQLAGSLQCGSCCSSLGHSSLCLMGPCCSPHPACSGDDQPASGRRSRWADNSRCNDGHGMHCTLRRGCCVELRGHVYLSSALSTDLGTTSSIPCRPSALLDSMTACPVASLAL